MKEKRQDSFTIHHKDKIHTIFIFEIWMVENPDNDKSNALGFKEISKGSLFFSVKVEDDDLFEDILQGKVKGFSIELLADLININLSKEYIFELDDHNRLDIVNQLSLVKELTDDEFLFYSKKILTSEFAKIKEPKPTDKWIWTLRPDQKGRKQIIDTSRDFCKRNVSKIFSTQYIENQLETELQAEPTKIPNATFKKFWKQKLVNVDGEKKSPWYFNCAHQWFPLNY
jgi:hypothetical protein